MFDRPVSELPEGHAGLWCFSVAHFAEHEFDLLLSPQEQARLDRFVYQSDRDLYATAHVGLRLVLSHLLSTPALDIQFDRSCLWCGAQHGRPEISYPATPLRFSLSHSGELAVIAVANEAIGVDIQAHKESLDLLGLTEYCLTDSESAELDDGIDDIAPASFFDIWSCKEAVLKACGKGLAVEMNKVELDVAATQQRRPHKLRNSSGVKSLDAALVEALELSHIFPDVAAQLFSTGSDTSDYSLAVANLSGRHLTILSAGIAAVPAA